MPETTGHIAFSVRKQRAMTACFISAPIPHLHSPESQLGNDAPIISKSAHLN